MEYTSTKNLSTNLQGWKMQIWKTQVPKCMGGIRKYGKRKYKSAGVEIVSMETKRAILMETFHSYFRQLVEASHPGFSAFWRCSKVEQKRTNLQTKRKPTWWMIDGSAVQLMSMNGTLLMTVQVVARSNKRSSVTVLTASCDVCLNAPCVKLSQYHGEMQLFLSSVLTHSSPPILALLCVAV